MKLAVRTNHGKDFRRNGILFTEDARVIDTEALGWTPAQVAALRATPTLEVKDAKPEDEKRASKAARSRRARERAGEGDDGRNTEVEAI